MECHLSVARPLIGRCRVSQRRSSAPLAAALPGGREGGTFPSQTRRGGNFFVWDLSDSFSSPRKSGAAGTKTSAIQAEAAGGRGGRGSESSEGGGNRGARKKRPLPLVAIFVTSPPGDTSTRTHRSINVPRTAPAATRHGKVLSGPAHQRPHAALHAGGPPRLRHRRNKRE